MLSSSLLAHPAPTPVRVVAWNVYDLPEPLFSVESSKRMDQVATSLAKHCRPMASVDAVVLTELYVEKDKKKVLAGLSEMGLHHHAELAAGRFMDRFRLSGIVVASRWPIESHDSVIFRSGCHGLDCFANKGAVYVKLMKQLEGRVEPINLFATHFYLGRPGHYAEDRKMQASSLAAFVREKTRSHDEITVLAGDLNASWLADGPAVLATLGGYPVEPSGDLTYTFVGQSGHLLSGSPTQSISQRCARHADAANELSDLQAGRKWIDYVVALAPGRKPSKTHLWAVEAKGSTYTFGASSAASCRTDELSDHYPVVGDFLFE